MAEIKRKKGIVEYIIPWLLLILVFVVLVFVFNQDNTIKTYSENQVYEALEQKNGESYLKFESLTITEKTVSLLTSKSALPLPFSTNSSCTLAMPRLNLLT